MCRNADIVSPDRSCKRLLSSKLLLTLQTSKSMMPWRAISAVAEPTNEFARQSSWQQEKLYEPNGKCKPAAVPQRRLWGRGAYPRGAIYPTGSRAGTIGRRSNRRLPGNPSSQYFCRNSARWNGLHRGTPLRDGNG